MFYHWVTARLTDGKLRSFSLFKNYNIFNSVYSTVHFIGSSWQENYMWRKCKRQESYIRLPTENRKKALSQPLVYNKRYFLMQCLDRSLHKAFVTGYFRVGTRYLLLIMETLNILVPYEV